MIIMFVVTKAVWKMVFFIDTQVSSIFSPIDIEKNTCMQFPWNINDSTGFLITPMLSNGYHKEKKKISLLFHTGVWGKAHSLFHRKRKDFSVKKNIYFLLSSSVEKAEKAFFSWLWNSFNTIRAIRHSLKPIHTVWALKKNRTLHNIFKWSSHWVFILYLDSVEQHILHARATSLLPRSY